MQIAFYGTLMSAFPVQRRLGVEAALYLRRACLIPGRLISLGRYPGLLEGDARVVGELYAILQPAVLRTLDAFEGPDFLRKKVTLLDPVESAWVYYYRGPTPEGGLIPSGSWMENVGRRVRGRELGG